MLEVIIIKPGMEDLNDGDKITFGAGLTALCGDLIRLNSDGSYNLIHSSLKDYLLDLSPSEFSPLHQY